MMRYHPQYQSGQSYENDLKKVSSPWNVAVENCVNDETNVSRVIGFRSSLFPVRAKGTLMSSHLARCQTYRLSDQHHGLDDFLERLA